MTPSRRDSLLMAIAKARSWVDELANGRVGSFAVLARREGKVERKSIRVGMDNGRDLEVLEGLSEKDEVIAEAARLLGGRVVSLMAAPSPLMNATSVGWWLSIRPVRTNSTLR